MRSFFSDGDLNPWLNSLKERLRGDIEGIGSDTIGSLDPVKKTVELHGQYMLECPVLNEDEYEIKEENENAVNVRIPFKGHSSLFYRRPSQYTLNPPRGDTQESSLIISYDIGHRDKDKFQKEHSKNIDDIKKFLGWVESDVNRHNEWIMANTRKLIDERVKNIKERKEFIKTLDL